MSSVTDEASGRQVTLGYSGTDLASVTDPNGGTTNFTYSGTGELTTLTTAAGRSVNFGYDSTGSEVTSMSQSDPGATSNPTWNFAYTPSSYNTSGTFVNGSTKVTDPNSNATTYSWDNANRVTKTTDPNGQSKATTWNTDNDVVNSTDPGGNVTTFAWDPTTDVLNKVTEPTTSGTGASLNYSYTDSTDPYVPTKVTQMPEGNSTSYTYNADRQVTAETDGLSSQNSESVVYDSATGTICGLVGQVCSITTADGNKTTYSYDSVGNLTKITPPSATGTTQLAATTFTYTPDGSVATETDGRGDTTTYTYNPNGQVTKTAYSGPGTTASTVTLGYDADGNLTSRSNGTGTEAYTYNPVGELATSSDAGATTTYGYDPIGNLTTLTGPAGTTTYAYSKVNEPTSVTDPWNATTTLAYTSGNDRLLASISYPDQVKEAFGYDKADRVTSLTATNTTTNATLVNYAYNYTAGGSTPGDSFLLQSTTDTTGQTTTYGYDAVDRLTTATGGGTNYSYAYNGDGDPTSQTVGGATTNYTLNANGQNTADSYDASGNVTAANSIGSLGYNQAGQTSTITPNGGSAENLTYLDQGQNLLATAGATSYTYNSQGVDTSTANGTTTDYVRTPTGGLLEQRTGGSSYYYLLDPQGSVIGLAGPAGSLADHYTYSPIGYQNTLENNTPNIYGYASGLNLPNTNLTQFGARDYNPTSDTWTQTDPSGQNPAYQYAGDNPVNETDVSGEGVFGDIVGFGVAVIGFGIAVAGTFTANPVLVYAGLTVASAGLAIAGDTVACDFHTGFDCGQF